MGYTSIGTQIKAILDEVTGIDYVYNYANVKPGGYPAACIRAKGHQSSFQSLATNKRRFSFYVDILVKLDNPADAEARIRTLADAIITAIEADVTLNASCDYSEPSQGAISYGETDVKVQVAQLQVDCNTLVFR